MQKVIVEVGAVAMGLDSSMPLYYQIVSDIKQQISDGVLLPGEKLPAENALSEAYQVSRVTVRKALDDLCILGVTERRPNKGHFVAKIRDKQEQRSRSLHDTLIASGRTPSSHIISMTTEPASAAHGRLFGTEAGAPVIIINRVRCADGTPFALEHIYLPGDLFEGINPWELEHSSMIRMMQEQFHVKIAYSNQTLNPKTPTKQEMELLELTTRKPQVAVSSDIVSKEGRVVKHTEVLFVADVVEYSFTWYG